MSVVFPSLPPYFSTTTPVMTTPMMMSSAPSPPLHMLERHNYSKSTVSSSSDTDVDSIGYASSSGTTTPEDDTKTFHLGSTLQTVLTAKSKGIPREKLLIVPKPRNFSLAMKKVKKVAHALAAFKRKRPDDISPILISSPLRERFGRRMAVKSQPDESFYSLPNRRFSFSDVSTPPHYSEAITRKFGTISGPTSDFVMGTVRRQRGSIPSFSESDQQQDTPPSSPLQPAVIPRSQYEVWKFTTIFVHVLRILLFLPWCAAVGGALVLFPSHVELIAFSPGYLDSPKGIRRFAHWADCGMQHVMIFLACLAVIVWYNPALGVSLTSIVVTRVVSVWRAFEMNRTIPLGEDDQQSMYLVMAGFPSADGSFGVDRMAVKTDD